MKKNFSFYPFGKNILAGMVVAAASLTQLNAQCTLADAGNIQYGIRVINATNPVQYEAYATSTATGCVKIGTTQFSIIVSSGATINITNSDSGPEANFSWVNNTNFVYNGNRYSAVASSGSAGNPIPFTANSSTSLFVFTVTGTCTSGVRIFNNISDPNSATLGGGDYRNEFEIVIPVARDAYVSNISPSQNCPSVVLPLTLTDFSAKLSGPGQVILNWQTLNETNTSQFIVERSNTPAAANTDWKVIGTVAAAGTVTGTRNYQLTDLKPVNGVNYYRLRTTDKDGRETTSPVKQVTISSKGLLSVSVYPNPIERGRSISVVATQQIYYRLLDKTGRMLSAGVLAPGANAVKAPQAAGSYLLEVMDTQTAGSKENYRIIVQ